MIEGDPLIIKLTYTIDDSMRVASFLRNQSFLYRNDVWLTAGVVFIAFIVLILLMANDVGAVRIVGAVTFSLIPAIAAAVGVFALHRILHPWLMRRTIARYFAASPTAESEIVLTFSSNGIESRSDLVTSLTKWGAITSVTESDFDMLFFTGRPLTLFLPKRVFDSSDQLQGLKLLLAKILGEKARLKDSAN